MQRWIVLYDASCGLCKWLLALLLRSDRAQRLRPLALQQRESDALLVDLTPEQRAESWHLISPAGTRHSAGAAAAPLLTLLPGGRLLAAVFTALPGPTQRGYAWVAAHRSGLSKLIPARAKRRAGGLIRERESEGR
ncbi:MAG TPA: DCC1-like thiol-disulfide oxidoreductase family protein [Solirubrobacteraceae bacterium]|nr:DCC1-like thiol-disulfide oxidoreductase family protein [Solirubrobacteraceae bacterium]